jgi:peptidoglycan L-alanyl-D-glutamate endopeptidase CwlK
MINSRKIEDLHPKVAKMCKEFIKKCDEAGIDVIITSTYRDAEAQNALFAQGRTAPGKIVTRARAGQSYHNWRVAFDFVPVINGKAVWSNDDLWLKCGEIAESIGLEWAGRWTKFREMPHCQYTGGLSIFDFQQGKQL